MFNSVQIVCQKVVKLKNTNKQTQKNLFTQPHSHLSFRRINQKWEHGGKQSTVTSGMWNTKLDSISPLLSTHIRAPPPSESSDTHYGQMESYDFMLCNTFNRQMLWNGQHFNVFLDKAQENWVEGCLTTFYCFTQTSCCLIGQRWSDGGDVNVCVCMTVCQADQRVKVQPKACTLSVCVCVYAWLS